jgi:tetratricopeptide (TPR) repeat protein
LLVSLFAGLLIPVVASGQEMPKMTKEGREALDKLAAACFDGGGLNLVDGPRGKQVRVADEDKLRATVAAHQELLTPALRDALVAGWNGGDEAARSAYLALLRAYGDEKEDELALAYAAFMPAWVAKQRREYGVACRLYQEAQQHFGAAKELAWQALSLNNIGRIYSDQGEYGKALDYHQRALAMQQKLYDGPHPNVAASLDNMGAVHALKGEYAKALEYQKQALAMRQKLYDGPHPDIALSLNNIGTVYRDQGGYTEALDHHQRALAVYQKLYAGPHPDTAMSLSNIGTVYEAQGEYARAMDYGQRALAMRQKLYAGPHPDIATSLNNIATVSRDQGEFAKALEYCQRSLAMCQRLYPGPHPYIATSLNNVGVLYDAQGEKAKALDYYQRALAMRQKLYEGPHPAIALSLNNVGDYYRALGEYAKALDHLQQALAMDEKLYTRAHPDISTTFNNIGAVYDAQGEHAQALDYYQRALAMDQKLYEGPHPDIARRLYNIGFVYDELGEYAKGMHSWDEALQLLRLVHTAEPIPFDRLQERDLRPLPMTVHVVFWRGLVSEKASPRNPGAADLRACERTYALASDLLDRVRHETIEREADRLRHGADWSALTPRRVGLCRRLFELTGDLTDLATAFQAAEQGRARVFLEALAASRAGLLGGVSPERRDKEAELLRRLREYDVRIEREENNPGKGDTPLPKLWEGRQQAEAELLKLIAGMEMEFPRYAALKYPKPCSVEDARACLDANEVALHFVLGKEESCLLLLEAKPAPGDKAQGLAIYALPGRDAIADGVTPLVDPDTLALPARVRGLGTELYSQLLAPLAGRLRGKDLVIVPDGPLGYMPFELLVEEMDGGSRFLVEGHRIRYAPSLTALHLDRQWAAHREHQPDRSLWALGDPVYSADDDRLSGKPALAAASRDAARDLAWREGQGQERFGRLRYSGQEVEKVRERLGKSGGGCAGREGRHRGGGAAGVCGRRLGPGPLRPLRLSRYSRTARRPAAGPGAQPGGQQRRARRVRPAGRLPAPGRGDQPEAERRPGGAQRLPQRPGPAVQRRGRARPGPRLPARRQQGRRL